MLVTDRVEISPTAREFLRASIRWDRFRRRRALTVLSVLLVGALVAAGIAVSQRHSAQQGLHLATARLLISQANTLLGADPDTALKLGIAAHHLNPSGETHANLLTTLATTRYAGTLTGHTGPVYSVAFAPDGHTLASASSDQTVRLWDLTDRAHPSPLGPPLTGHAGEVDSVAFAPDGHTLASAGTDGSVRLWDLSDRAHPSPLGLPLTGHTDQVYSVAFAPDGHTLASSGADGSVRLWDLSDRAHPSPLNPPLTGHTGAVVSVAFAPDGRTLASTSWDQTVRLWDLRGFNDAFDHTGERACAITRGGLTPDEWTRYISGLPYQDTCPS